MKKVKDIELKKGSTINKIIKEFYESGGFTAKQIAQGVEIIEDMIKDKNCIKFLSFPACIVATGTRGVIRELLRRNFFDVVITTAGTLDHDIARIWKDYYHGSFMVDDKELHKRRINRLGNIFIPNECYGIILEEKIQPVLEEIHKKNNRWSTKDLIWEFGKYLEKEKNRKKSIIYWAYKNKIPVFIPGITDGAFGFQIWMYHQRHRDFFIDVLKDEQELSDIIFEAKKSGALIIGGGISKHHTIWWNQFKDGLDYAVYITTALEYDGSLGGAQTREAISWGKIKEKAKNVTINGDATVLLPLMIAALIERIK